MGLKVTINVEGGHGSTAFHFGAEHYAADDVDPRRYVHEFRTGTAKLVDDLSSLVAGMTPEGEASTDDVVLASLGTRTYRTLTIDAATLPDCLHALAGYLEGPDCGSFAFDSLTHSRRDGRTELVVDLSNRF